MDREYTIVLAAGVVALALAGASRAEAPKPGAAILENGINATQQHIPLDAISSDMSELPAFRGRTSGEFPLITPLPTDRPDPATICACPTPKLLLQFAPLVG